MKTVDNLYDDDYFTHNDHLYRVDHPKNEKGYYTCVANIVHGELRLITPYEQKFNDDVEVEVVKIGVFPDIKWPTSIKMTHPNKFLIQNDFVDAFVAFMEMVGIDYGNVIFDGKEVTINNIQRK